MMSPFHPGNGVFYQNGKLVNAVSACRLPNRQTFPRADAEPDAV
ncbi:MULTISPECIES: hypothetical protein [Neisseria]|nr:MULTISPECIES: hypothetical protein [Neisseria]